MIRTTFFFILFLLWIFVFVTTWFFSTFVIIRFWLKSTHSSGLSSVITTKTITFSISHLVVILLEQVFFSLVVQELILILFLLLTLEFFDNVILFQSSLLVFGIELVKFVLKIVDICKLFDVNIIETFKLKLETFIFFLIFWLDILDSFKSFFCSFKFLFSSCKFI